MVVRYIADLFDVVIEDTSSEGKLPSKAFHSVSIGTGFGPDFPEDLVGQIITSSSELVVAKVLEKGAILTLPRGRTTWLYLDGDGDRFDSADLDAAHFVNEVGEEQAIFDTSRFTPDPPEQAATVFAGLPSTANTPVTITFHWKRYQPGGFVVNLPDDLPDQFGSRFDQVRFGLERGTTESYKGVVTEPDTDANYIGKSMAVSTLVDVSQVQSAPLGWDPVPIPFKHPRVYNLTGGTDSVLAQIYLSEEGASNLIKLSAKQDATQSGMWGNDISVSVRRSKSGPAYFDVTVAYEGAVLENARLAVMGGSQPPLPDDDLTHQLSSTGSELLKPGPVGILQAKAAGIQANVTRDRT
jgi:hypothetical protein